MNLNAEHNSVALGDELSHWTKGYLGNQHRWDELVEEQFPGAVLIKWGLYRRVYLRTGRIIKVQNKTINGKISKRHELRKEYEINLLCEDRLWKLKPEYRNEPGEWEIMEIDHLPGPTLNVLIASREAGELSLLALIRSLMTLSWLGVAYKQLRGRHIFVGADRRPVFIDFGDSRRTTRWLALRKNLFPFRKKGGRWQLSNFGYLAGVLVRQKCCPGAALTEDSGYIKDRTYESIAPEAVAIQLRKNCGDLERVSEAGSLAALNSFRKWKRAICDWAKERPDRGCDLFRWEFKEGAVVWGGESWGVIWDAIRKRVQFQDQAVVEYGCSLGLGPVHARLEGARSVVSVSDDPGDVKVGQRAVDFFGVDRVRFSLPGAEGLDPRAPRGAIGLALSISANESNWDRVREALSGCSVIVRRTPNGVEYLKIEQ